MLSAASQVLIRNAQLFDSGRWALVNPQDAFIFTHFENAELSGFHQFYDIYQQAVATTTAKQQVFSASFVAQHPLDGAVVYMPKAKQHAKMLLANMAAYIKPGGQLLMVGDNKGGIRSAAKLLQSYGAQVNKIDSARHCSLFCVTLDKPAPPFSLSDYEQQFAVKYGDQEIAITSLPGVFSHGELDAGTKLLLTEHHSRPKGQVLDFACGAGVIGACLARQHPAIELTMTDVSALALHCAQRTVEQNGLAATIYPSHGLSDVQGTFDFIYTNPPFHTGVKTDYSVTHAFISGLRAHMNRGAKLVLVANRFLKYPDSLEQTFGNLTTIAQTSKFNLYVSRV